MKDAFSQFIEQVTNGLPIVTYMEFSFRVRPLGPEYLSIATANARSRAQELIPTLDLKSKSLAASEESKQSWIDLMGGGENGTTVSKMFGLASAKTQYDLDVAVFTMMAFRNYQCALAVVGMDGKERAMSELEETARFIGANPKLATMIGDALASFDKPEPDKEDDISKNDQPH